MNPLVLMFRAIQGIKRGLHSAAMLPTNDCAQLLEDGADPDVTDDYGRTPLHEAVRANAIDNVRILLNAGANPNIQDEDGQTPLHFAVVRNLSACIIAFLEGNADPSIRDSSGRTPYDILEAYKMTDHITPAALKMLCDKTSH